MLFVVGHVSRHIIAEIGNRLARLTVDQITHVGAGVEVEQLAAVHVKVFVGNGRAVVIHIGNLLGKLGAEIDLCLRKVTEVGRL